MWSIITYITVFLLTNIQSVWSSRDNQWDIQNDSLGRYTLMFNGDRMISGACPEFEYSLTGTRISVCDTQIYNVRKVLDPHYRSDFILGNYTEYNIDYIPISNAHLPEVNCVFKVLDTPKDSMLIRINLSKEIETNWFSPMSNGQWSIQTDREHTRILNIPPDNDLQSFYVSVTPSKLTHDTSNYVTAFYEHNSDSNKGLIVGFLEHTVFKTGIEFTEQSISAVAGVNGLLLTRDRVRHGIVNSSHSPLLFIHMNSDWRLGMETYADMIAKMSPQSKSIEQLSGSLPMASWNSWAMAVGQVGQPNIKNLFAASDVLESLASLNFGPTQYIVRDAVYNLNQTQTDSWVRHVHTYNNQQTGSYTSPAVVYKESQDTDYHVNCNLDSCVPQLNSTCYLFNDIILKDKTGNPILPLNNDILVSNKRILDVTHPITMCIMRTDSRRIIGNNMSFVKYDFLNYAAYEGYHHNQTIAQTGMQAYTYLLSLLDIIWNHTVILNYGISLPFPVGSGMTMRRQSCDQMFGGVAYSMNSYTYGWWLSRLYMLNPDMIAFQENYWFNVHTRDITKYISMDYISRVAKAVVVGGLYENGDDLSNITNVNVMKQYMGNSKVNSMWLRSRVGYPDTMFRPISYTSQQIVPFLSDIQPASIYIRQNGDIAIFNFGIYTETYTINITHTLPIFNNIDITCTDIWTGQNKHTNDDGILQIIINKTSSILLECR